MSGKKKGSQSTEELVEDPAKLARAEKRRRSLAIVLSSAGLAMTLGGLLIGRGSSQNMVILQIRLFLFVVGFSLALVGFIGLVTVIARWISSRKDSKPQ